MMKPGLIFEDEIAMALGNIQVFSGSNVRIFRNRVYPGAKDPQGYEIDIAVELLLSEGLNLLIMIECKSSGRPVARSVVQHVIQVRDDISAHKAIIISSNGFQTGAVRLAQKSRIALWQWVNRRFKHVLYQMHSLYEHQSYNYILVRGLKQYFANRGISIDAQSLTREIKQSIQGTEGLAIYPVNLVKIQGINGSHTIVNPPDSKSGLTIYASASAPTPGLNFVYEVIRAIISSNTDQSKLLHAHLRVARGENRGSYAYWLDNYVFSEKTYDELQDDINRIDLRRKTQEERERIVNKEDEVLRQLLFDLGEKCNL
ncbi:MAG: restriction endonuclease [Candidatus Aminicenantes bacterium]|nr:MAG: restriction endonuclease [Candidatus Aminicenantes bacterium]